MNENEMKNSKGFLFKGPYHKLKYQRMNLLNKPSKQSDQREFPSQLGAENSNLDIRKKEPKPIQL